ncbi:hypothetical protein HBH70_187870 [Parastagonospora nodorum]|nr:hypothetical protein HBH53_239080 [Parastagonospora nodorum]KAH4043000.1 hypothetical protein HBH49_240450 [Parastagonospora nodorum]KAH4184193.1 hypothetical protein HBH42_192930 [Parastagonospora nodorum]KAH4195332.1 hypothetical protein HBI95_197090 [Parastagonospora nodorum]KAH4218658.1 hypothetical protein HBI06_197950 [Parastagonospora nodorum]
MSRDSRSPTIEPTTLPDQTPGATEAMTPRISTSVPSDEPSAKMLADMKHDIEVQLEATTRKEFHNAVNGLMWIGGRKIKAVEPRRQRIRHVVSSNKQIARAYAEFATAHRVGEKRVTFQLPLVETNEEQGEGQTDIEGVFVPESIRGQEANDTEAANSGEPGVEMEEDVMVGLKMDKRTDEDKRQASREKSMEGVGEQAVQPSSMRREPTTAPGGLSLVLSEARRRSRQVVFDIRQAGQVARTPQKQRQKARSSKSKEQGDVGAPAAGTESEDVEMTDTTYPASEASHPQMQTPIELPVLQRSAMGKQIAKRPKQSPWSGPPAAEHSVLVPVTNPEAFPVERIQVVQSQHYPSAKIMSMQTHRDIQGGIGQVTADIQDGPVNRLLIKDYRLVQALGLLHGANDTIAIRTFDLRIDETFEIILLPGQRPKDLKNFVVGELVPARHAYLHWLDYRGTADPKYAPFAMEARYIAVQLGRRAMDVWKEVDGYWQLEQGSGGSAYRRNRLMNLGEDPVYEGNGKRTLTFMSMWG